MTATEFDEAKAIWRMFYARNCFQRAKDAANYMFQNKMQPDNILFYSLVCAIHTQYASPFTNWKGIGKLDENIVPPEHLQQHKQLLDHRHQIQAHRDSNPFQIADFGPPNQIRLRQTVDGNRRHQRLAATDFHVNYQALPPIIALCAAMEKIAEDESARLWEKHGPKVPKSDGDFVLNILDEKGDMWIPVKRS